METKYIKHTLNKLFSHLNNIQAHLYTNLGHIENKTLTDDEMLIKINIEIELMKARITDLKLDI